MYEYLLLGVFPDLALLFLPSYLLRYNSKQDPKAPQYVFSLPPSKPKQAVHAISEPTFCYANLDLSLLSSLKVLQLLYQLLHALISVSTFTPIRQSLNLFPK